MNIEILGTKLDALRSDLDEQRAILTKLSDSFTLLARVEERQTSISIGLDRAFQAIERLDVRLQTAEARLPAFSQTSVWVERFIIALVVALGTYVAKEVGLL